MSEGWLIGPTGKEAWEQAFCDGLAGLMRGQSPGQRVSHGQVWGWLPRRWRTKLRDGWLRYRVGCARGWRQTGMGLDQPLLVHAVNTAWLGANVVSVTRVEAARGTAACRGLLHREQHLCTPQPGLRSPVLLPVSSWVERQLRAHYAIQDTPVMVLPPAVDTECWQPATPMQRLEARRRHGFSPEAWVIGCQAPLDESGWQQLAAALAAAGNASMALLQGPSTGLGHGLQASRVRVAASPAGAGEGGKLWHACDVFLALPRAEPVGLAALQVAACGLPIVAQNPNEVADLVIDGVTGGLGSTPSWLSWLRRHPERAQQMGSAARDQVDTHFSHRVVRQRLEAIYASVRRGTAPRQSLTNGLKPALVSMPQTV